MTTVEWVATGSVFFVAWFATSARARMFSAKTGG